MILEFREEFKAKDFQLFRLSKGKRTGEAAEEGQERRAQGLNSGALVVPRCREDNEDA